MKTAVVIPFFKGEKYIDKCLSSMNLEAKDITVFIIDNDENPLKLNVQNSKIEIIRTQPGLGFAKAVNYGVYHAFRLGFKHFVILNQDTWFLQNGLQNLLDGLASNPAELVMPQIYDYEGTNIHPVFEHYLLEHRDESDQKKLQLFPAVCWAFDAQFLKDHLLFDPLFYHYFEDYDFIYRTKLKASIIDNSRLAHFAAVNLKLSAETRNRDINYLKGQYLLNCRFKKEKSSHLIKGHLQYFLLKKLNIVNAAKYLSFVLSHNKKTVEIKDFNRTNILDRTIKALGDQGFTDHKELRSLLNA